VTFRLDVIGLAWASCTKEGPMLLEQSRLDEIRIAWARSHGASSLGEFGRALVSASAFQLSL